MDRKKTYTFTVRVRYSETDQMGYVYYGNYARFYEIGRTETMRELGIEYKGLEEKGIMMPVISLQVRYLRPARYDDLLTLETRIKSLTEREIIFDTNIYNEKSKLLNQGIVKLCFVDKNSGKRILTPRFILDKLAENDHLSH